MEPTTTTTVPLADTLRALQNALLHDVIILTLLITALTCLVLIAIAARRP